MDTSRLVSLQMLRAFAATLVAAYHFVPHWHLVATGQPAALLLWFGFWGIDVFFVLSGFVMWWTTAAPGSGAPGRFLVKRLVRIFPPYWIVVAGLCVLAGSLPARPLETLLLLPQPLGEMPLPVAWTLEFEVLFYVAFALLLLGAPDLGRRRSLVAGIVAAVSLAGAVLWALGAWTPAGFTTLRAGLGASLPSELLQMAWSPYQLEFFGGALLASRLTSRAAIGPPRSPLAAAAGIAALLSLAVFLSMRVFGEHLNQGYFALQHVLLFGPPSLLTVALLYRLEGDCVQLARRGIGRIGLWLGDGSYSIYLFHTFVYEIVARLGLRDVAARAGRPGAAAFLLVLPATVFLAAAFGHLVELPLHRFLARRLVPAPASPRRDAVGWIGPLG